MIAYRLLSGQLPYAGESRQALLTAQLTRRPLRISMIQRSVDPTLEQLVMQLLERSRDDRPESAAQVLTVLEAIASGALPLQRLPRCGRSVRESAPGLSARLLAAVGRQWFRRTRGG